jgi:hypothetical protein
VIEIAGLPAIIAYARAGALDHAWSCFVAAGYDRVVDEPAALTVKGRLLKDRARRAEGAERRWLLGEASAAYARAAALDDATYPLINAATLALLGGDAAGSVVLAERVLARIAAHPDEPETPYYPAATRAEALLLLGRESEAQAALGEAIALAPCAWEDHASTLRQFAAIIAARGGDAAWLEALGPPRSLHFAGHMSFRADADHAALVGRLADILSVERIGFGFGAAAAGADILIAEALLARGAELHLVLPGGAAAFAAISVDPFGDVWRQRFDAVVARATAVRTVSPAGVLPDQPMIDFADEVAMGAARSHAARLTSEAVQLLVLPDTAGESDRRARRLWADAGGRQHLVTAARDETGTVDVAAGPAASTSLAVLAIRIATPAADPAIDLTWVKALLDRAPAPLAAPVFTGEAEVIGYGDLAAAAAAAAALIASPAIVVTVGGHYGLTTLIADPFSGGARVGGSLLAVAQAAAASALPRAICVSGDFADALAIACPDRFHDAAIGELDDSAGGEPITLHALEYLGPVSA